MVWNILDRTRNSIFNQSIDWFPYFCDWISFLAISSFWLLLTACSTPFVWLTSELNADFSSDNLSSASLIRALNCVISSLFIFMADSRLCREPFSSRNTSSFLRFAVLISPCNRSTSSKRARFDFSATFNLTSSCRIRSSASRSRFGLYPAGLCFRPFTGTRLLSGGRGELMSGR